jgi:BioD-like phosphotransacetylase family protein
LVALYITSLAKGAGKTTVCAGLGKHFLNDGKKVGFFKPFTAGTGSSPKEGIDSDVAFLKYLFALSEPIDILSPVFNNESSLKSGIKEAYNKVSQDKDIVIIEGISDQTQAFNSIVEALNARVLLVEGYSKDLLEAVNRYKDFGEHLLGVLVNKVPVRQVENVRTAISIQFDKAGVNTLGLLPEDRSLLAVTISELAEHIHGEILSNAEKSAELVENVMLGAMTVDPGPDYFGRKANKAAIIRSERPDMQLATLETSTRCLVLTGNTAPMPVVLYRAQEKNVPIILTGDDITTVITNIEAALGNIRFNQENKLPKLAEIMEQNLDFQTVYRGLGLAV